MLTIYSAQEFRDDCLIEVKDYFDLERRHWNEWLNQEKVKEIIKDIDNTIAVKDSYLESPVFGAMSPDRLSYAVDSIYEMFNNGDSEYWIEPIFPVG